MALRAHALVLLGVLTVPAALGRAQVDTVVPGPTLVVDAVPAIPAALARDVRRYTEFRSASLAGWHPVRREILISTRFDNAPQLHAVKMPGGARTQLTFADEPITGGTYEPTEGRFLIYAKDEGGNEFDQLYRHDLGDGQVTLLTDGGRSQNGGAIWSTRGDRIAYTSTRRNGTDRDVYVMNPSEAKSDRLLLQLTGGGWSATDWSPDDARLVVFERISVSKSHLWLVDAATGAKAALSGAADAVAYGQPRFSRDGRGVYVTADKDSEFQRLCYLDLTTKALTPLTADLAWDVDDFELSHDGRSLAFVANEAGASKLYLMDTASRRYRPAPGVPAGVVGALRWHRRTGELAFTVSSARSASDVYSLAPDGSEIARWTASELGGLVASELSEPEPIRWRSFDGLEIGGFYYRPPARFTGKRPVIINIHGGPEGQSRPGFLGRSNYYLNELGVAVIYPNVRGSTGQGKRFVSLDNGMKREDSVKDIGALLDWIAARPELDASRVMVTGGSYGGYMTLAVATMYSDRIRCAVDVVGISNFNTFFKNTESYRRDLRRVEYGDERDPAMAAYFERIAPLNNAGRITKPLFVVQGGNDPRVPRTEAGHGFDKKANADFQFYATVMFVRTYLVDRT